MVEKKGLGNVTAFVSSNIVSDSAAIYFIIFISATNLSFQPFIDALGHPTQQLDIGNGPPHPYFGTC